MKSFSKILALVALALTIGPAAWLFVDGVSRGAPSTAAALLEQGDLADGAVLAPEGFMTEGLMKTSMGVGAVLWFVAAPKWLREGG